MRGTVNVPAGGKKTTLDSLGAAAKDLSNVENTIFAKKCQSAGVVGGTSTAFFGTIGLDWVYDAATGVKSQLVALEGVLAAHQTGCLDVIMTHERTPEGYAAFVEETNQFLNYITNGDAETVDGGVMFYIYGEANTVEIPFALEVG